MSHIALVLPDLEAGGAQRVALTLAREFVACGHRVDLVLIQGDGAFHSLVSDGVRLVDLRARETMFAGLGLAFYAIFRLAAWIRLEHPAVILSTVTGTNLVALLVKRLSSIPFKLVIREAVTLQNVRSRLRMRAMRWLYPLADAVVAVSPVIAAELAERICVSRSRIHCIGNPVDAAMIQEKAADAVDHPWLYDERKNVVIAVGRLIPQKDYATLLRAFALLTRELRAHLIVVGEGPERANLEQLIHSLNISDCAQLIGFDLNPWRWIARARLFVLPSKWEGHPNALLEAMALGLPAVVAAYDQSVNALANNACIAVVPVGDVEAMALAMAQQLSLPEALCDSVPVPGPTDIALQYLAVLEGRLCRHAAPRPT